MTKSRQNVQIPEATEGRFFGGKFFVGEGVPEGDPEATEGRSFFSFLFYFSLFFLVFSLFYSFFSPLVLLSSSRFRRPRGRAERSFVLGLLGFFLISSSGDYEGSSPELLVATIFLIFLEFPSTVFLIF